MDLEKKFEVITLHEGKWLNLKAINFKIREKNCVWECVERAQNHKASFGGVDVIPIFQRKNQKDKILIIASYRIPIFKFVLEFPSGLMDDNYVEENALRELKEETGYTSSCSQIFQFKSKHQGTFSDPWKSTEHGCFTILKIDGDAPENITPQQSLEDEEDIRVHFVDLDDNICDNLSKLAKDENYEIQSSLWSFALGYSLTKIIAQQD